jgi:DNA-binding NtrC family response regulator
VVVVVSDDHALGSSLELVCDFLDIGVEHVSSLDDLAPVLKSQRPMAVVTDIDGAGQDGFNVMMTVAGYDPNLPIMILTGGDPRLDGAVEAVQGHWGLGAVTAFGTAPKVADLVDFFCRAGRRAGVGRMMAI